MNKPREQESTANEGMLLDTETQITILSALIGAEMEKNNEGKHCLTTSLPTYLPDPAVLDSFLGRIADRLDDNIEIKRDKGANGETIIIATTITEQQIVKIKEACVNLSTELEVAKQSPTPKKPRREALLGSTAVSKAREADRQMQRNAHLIAEHIADMIDEAEVKELNIAEPVSLTVSFGEPIDSALVERSLAIIDEAFKQIHFFLPVEFRLDPETQSFVTAELTSEKYEMLKEHTPALKEQLENTRSEIGLPQKAKIQLPQVEPTAEATAQYFMDALEQASFKQYNGNEFTAYITMPEMNDEMSKGLRMFIMAVQSEAEDVIQMMGPVAHQDQPGSLMIELKAGSEPDDFQSSFPQIRENMANIIANPDSHTHRTRILNEHGEQIGFTLKTPPSETALSSLKYHTMVKDLAIGELEKMTDGTYKASLEPYPNPSAEHDPNTEFGVQIKLEIPSTNAEGFTILRPTSHLVLELLTEAITNVLPEYSYYVQGYVQEKDTKTNHPCHRANIGFPHAESEEIPINALKENKVAIIKELDALVKESTTAELHASAAGTARTVH